MYSFQIMLVTCHVLISKYALEKKLFSLNLYKDVIARALFQIIAYGNYVKSCGINF